MTESQADKNEMENLVKQNLADDTQAMDCLSALAALETDMGKADQEFKAATTPEEKRGAVCIALESVHRLLIATGMLTYVGPVVEVIFALDSLDKGVVAPLLKMGQRDRGRPKTPNVVWVQRAVVAAALEQHLRVQPSLPLAAAEVARWLAGSSVLRDVKSAEVDADADALLDWREYVMALMSDKEPKKVYENYAPKTAVKSGKYKIILSNKAALRRELKTFGVI